MANSDGCVSIYRLDETDYPRVKRLFQELDYNLQITSILEGRTRGRVYADDTIEPRTAFIWDESYKFFLSGDAEDPIFNEALNRLILGEIYPEARRRKIWGWVLHYHPESWERVLDTILSGTRPMKDNRYYYTFSGVRVDWRALIGEGDDVVKVDHELLGRGDLVNVDSVRKEASGAWGSIENYHDHAFGYCLIHGDTVACWCLSEFNSGDRCEIGVETDEGHRGRYYATVTASAFLEHCVERGIRLGWHCWESNTPSRLLAEKIGFTDPLVYPIYFDWFDDLDSLLVNAGWSLNRLDRPREAAEYYEQAFMKGDARAVHYFDAARAHATIGENGKAIERLHGAVERGWSDLNQLLSEKSFIGLYHENDWEKIMSELMNKSE